MSLADGAHSDSGHSDRAHSDGAHSDRAHADRAHADQASAQRSAQRLCGGTGSPKMNLRPNRSCCPVPLHCGQTRCAYLATDPLIFGLFLQFEQITHGLSFNDAT